MNLVLTHVATVHKQNNKTQWVKQQWYKTYKEKCQKGKIWKKNMNQEHQMLYIKINNSK